MYSFDLYFALKKGSMYSTAIPQDNFVLWTFGKIQRILSNAIFNIKPSWVSKVTILWKIVLLMSNFLSNLHTGFSLVLRESGA